MQLQQVLMNLIVNSIEAMKEVEDGTREVAIKSLQADKQQLMVSVSDTGVGLPRSRQDLRWLLYHRAVWDRHGFGLAAPSSNLMGAAYGRLITCLEAQASS